MNTNVLKVPNGRSMKNKTMDRKWNEMYVVFFNIPPFALTPQSMWVSLDTQNLPSEILLRLPIT